MRVAKIFCVLFILFLATYFFTGCQYHKADIIYPCDTTVVRYSVEIKAILDLNCQNCHGADPEQNINSHGINLYDYSTISSLALDSLCDVGSLVSAVSRNGCTSFMPKGQPKLSDCDINKFTAWVQRGAPDN
jgi:hypothetical protein